MTATEPETHEETVARIKRQSMRDHAFVGGGPYCAAWNAPVSRSTTDGATLTMQTGCGYPRDLHPEVDE